MNNQRKIRHLDRLEHRLDRFDKILDSRREHISNRLDQRKAKLSSKLNLKQGQIIVAALELLSENGLNDLSLRDIAKKLDVQAPALYWYFRSKSELVDYIAEAILNQEFTDMKPRTEYESWQNWLTGCMVKLRKAMLAYPDGGRVVAGAHLNPTVTLAKIFEYALESLTGASVDTQTALRTIMTACYYTFGYVIEEQASPNLVQTAESFGSKSLAELYPNMAHAISESTRLGITQDDNFLAGLQFIIAGAAT